MWKRTALTLALFGIFIGISGAAYFSDKKKDTRGPNSHKMKNLWLPSQAGKQLALFKVEIEVPEAIPEDGQDEVTLIGKIRINQEVSSDLTFSWSFPNDVTIIEGEREGSFAGSQSGQIIETKIRVLGFSKEKQRLISLQASGRQKGEVLGGSAVIASRPEDTWEAVAPEMKRAADEQLQSEYQARPRR